MATALGPVAASTGLRFQISTANSHSLKYANECECIYFNNNYRRTRTLDFGSSRLLSGNVSHSGEFVPRPTLESCGKGLQTPAVHRSACYSRAAGLSSGVGALAVEEPSVVEKDEVQEEEKEYNWREQWYPLYLTAEVPRDAPLSLRVYDHDLVLFYDGNGELNCLEDQCPHRAAKLSDGQVIDGTLECLYHGWQFKGDGACVKIPQLPSGAVIPRSACARSYAIKESQEVVWVWMADKRSADESKIPWFEKYLEEGYKSFVSTHELPYDYSILVENLLDPAHIQISHDRTDLTAKRENAEALKFEVTERNARGFAAVVTTASNDNPFNYRFEAPSVLRAERSVVVKDGKTQQLCATFLIRPTGQGKCAVIVRFGATNMKGGLFSLLPSWIVHMLGAKVFEEDMAFLAAQNEVLIRKGLPTEKVYLYLGSIDTMIMEYRKWLDKVGKGMPYYFGLKTMSKSPIPAMQERAPAGLEAFSVSTQPSKGAFGHVYARDTTNRYFRHVVHCKACRTALAQFRQSQKVSSGLAALCAAAAIMLSNSKLKAGLVLSALFLAAFSWGSSRFVDYLTQNHQRMQKVR